MIFTILRIRCGSWNIILIYCIYMWYIIHRCRLSATVSYNLVFIYAPTTYVFTFWPLCRIRLPPNTVHHRLGLNKKKILKKMNVDIKWHLLFAIYGIIRGDLPRSTRMATMIRSMRSPEYSSLKLEQENYGTLWHFQEAGRKNGKSLVMAKLGLSSNLNILPTYTHTWKDPCESSRDVISIEKG